MAYFGYVRVSSYGQGLKETSLTVQEQFLKKRAESLGLVFILQKEVESGKDLEGRPILTKLIKTLKKGDYLGVYDESRLSRNAGDSIRIAQALANVGAILEIAGRVIDVENPTDELQYTINAAVVQWQRKVQNAKAKASIQLKRDNGEHIMSGSMYGYDLIRKRGKTTAVVNQDEAKVVKFIYDAFIKGKNLYSISKATEIPVSRCRSILLNPIYMGKYLIEKVDKFKNPEQITEDKLIKSQVYPAIVSEDDYWKVNSLYQQSHKPRDYAYRRSIRVLSGVYRASCCGIGLVYVTPQLSYAYYANTVHKPDCALKTRFQIREQDLDSISRATMLITLLSGAEVASFYAEQRNLLYGTIEEVKEKIIQKEKDLKDNTAKINHLVDLVTESGIDVALFKSKINELKKEESDIKNEITSLRITARAQEESVEDLIESENEESIDAFLSGDNEQVRNFYFRHIKNAVVYEDRIEILFANLKQFTVMRRKRGTKKFNDVAFKMFFKGEAQNTGTIDLLTGKVKFDLIETDDENINKYLNDYYAKLGQDVNSLL